MTMISIKKDMRTYICLLFQVFCFIESVTVNYIN